MEEECDDNMPSTKISSHLLDFDPTSELVITAASV